MRSSGKCQNFHPRAGFELGNSCSHVHFPNCLHLNTGFLLTKGLPWEPRCQVQILPESQTFAIFRLSSFMLVSIEGLIPDQKEGEYIHTKSNFFHTIDATLCQYNNLFKDYAVKFWLRQGVQRSQLVLGIPFFGRSYTLKDSSRWMPGSPVKSPGNEAR